VVYAYNNTLNRNRVVAAWREDLHRYDFYDLEKDGPIELPAAESVPVAERLDKIIGQVETALPNIMSLTNKLAAVLDNAASISGQLREPGGLTLWALGTNSNQQFATALTNANSLMTGVNTNLNQLTDQIGATLENLAGITSNLNVQLRGNTNLVGGAAKTMADVDDLVQGLKRHWLLRSAFKTKATNAPAKQ
jgi:ABC-type transporter Mla subunit MlaD